jgi:hypothetical protein
VKVSSSQEGCSATILFILKMNKKIPIIHFYYSLAGSKTFFKEFNMSQTKFNITVMSLLTLLAISLSSTSSFASDSNENSSGEEFISASCQKAAIRQAYTQLRQDTGWTADEANQVAYLHEPTHLDNDPENVVTVSVESTDIRQWDGYAAYKVTITPSAGGCTASAATLLRADGF